MPFTSLVANDYISEALTFTNTSATEISAFGLNMDTNVSANWKLEWKISFSYTSNSGAPLFNITSPGGATVAWGTHVQLCVDYDYGPGYTQTFDISEDTYIGTNVAPDFPGTLDDYHFVTITALILGYIGTSLSKINAIYPTVKTSAEDTIHILSGYGIGIGL